MTQTVDVSSQTQEFDVAVAMADSGAAAASNARGLASSAVWAGGRSLRSPNVAVQHADSCSLLGGTADELLTHYLTDSGSENLWSLLPGLDFVPVGAAFYMSWLRRDHDVGPDVVPTRRSHQLLFDAEVELSIEVRRGPRKITIIE
ncbi:hypothetical protein CMK11_00955 [Candidatus Poribacteria bacterium]|nr:hypothetical protein [Candidatus Poribacteria bacterium]